MVIDTISPSISSENGALLSVVAAERSEESLRLDVRAALGGLCQTEGYE